MSSEQLIVTCAGVAFALPIERIAEVVRMVAPVARLPRAPRYCLGAIDYHGRLVPLLDLAARLGLSRPRSAFELLEARVLLCRSEEQLLGYVVDAVHGLSVDRPTPLDSQSPQLGGLVTGSVRWQEEGTALLLDLRPGVLCPIGAGALLRQLVSELAARPPSALLAEPEAASAVEPGE